MNETSDALMETQNQSSKIARTPTHDAGEYFRERDGRKFASNPETPYQLPSDEAEFERLTKQHNAYLVGMGGLYPVPDLVEQVLAEKDGVTRKILDIGCGSGAWVLDMAQKFPHAQVYGLDLVPIPAAKKDLPPNVHFEIGDINHGPGHFANCMDVAHIRCVGGGLTDYAEAIIHVTKCLKEGGLLLILDADVRFCGEDMLSTQKMYTENQRDGSWMQRWFYEFCTAYGENGSNFQAIDQGLWGHSLLDQCGAGSLFVPIGPWVTSTDPEEAQRLKSAGELMGQNLKEAFQTMSVVMKKYGVPQEFVDQGISEVLKDSQELDELNIHSWIRLRMLWGFRKEDDESSSGSLDKYIKSNWKPKQNICIFHSPEELQAAMQKWLDTVGEIPTSQVELAKRQRSTASQ